MILSDLIKKGGLAKAATMTPATAATQEADKSVTVAPVATVAVAVTPKSPLELSADEESRVRAWLAHIGETGQDIITEVIERRRADPNARQYLLQRAEEVPQTVTSNERITCGSCAHFEHIDHPHLGHCTKGEPEAIAGLWDTTDRRYCKQYLTGPDTPGNDKSTTKMAETKG